MGRSQSLWGIVLVVAMTAALCVTATPALALEPSANQELENDTPVGSTCKFVNESTNDLEESWSVATLEPERRHSAEGEEELASYTMPRVPEFNEKYGSKATKFYLPEIAGTGTSKSAGGGCEAHVETAEYAEAEGGELKLFIPGPYVLEEVQSSVTWSLASDDAPPPPEEACTGNDRYYPNADGRLEPPPGAPPVNEVWVITKFCNKVHAVHFFVLGGKGSCPVVGDMSLWPQVGYINQYETGKRVGLPIGEGRAGGNACGPSSTLMAMREAIVEAGSEKGLTEQQLLKEVGRLPEIGQIFDGVMEKKRSEVKPEASNKMAGWPKSDGYLHSLGWRKAKWGELGTSPLAISYENEQTILKALEAGPLIISTAFGVSKWGETGGGHMIMIDGVDEEHPNEVDVYDPAGGFFSTPKGGYHDARGGHYGPGSCGYNVPYPLSWLLAYTTGRAYLQLGPPPLKDPPVLTVSDAEPETATAPEELYLQDAAGQKSGWVQGQEVSEIPESFVGQMPNLTTQPDAGENEFPGESTPESPIGPAPRGITITEPPAGTTLHVRSAAGGNYALALTHWSNGEELENETLKGAISPGADTPVTSAALNSTIAQTASENSEPTKKEPESANGGGGEQSNGPSGGTATNTSAGSGSQSASSSATASQGSTLSQDSAGHPAQPLTKAQKLAAALKACKKQPKRKRASCERAARSKYGAKAKKKGKKKAAR
jgi:hypothetical protein